MNRAVIIVLILLMNSGLLAQVEKVFFPDNLNIQPFTANFLEPKLGFLFKTGQNEIRMDIGNSREIVHFKLSDEVILSVGADLFTFTKLNGEQEFHFPVDAVDYLFGLNAGYKYELKEYSYGFRFRLSHISAHFVDGHYDNTTAKWKGERPPRVYSREFIEFFPFIKFGGLRTYAGFTYLFHVVPKDLGKGIYQIGMDYYFTNFNCNNFAPFAAYDFKLNKIGKYSGTNSFSLGIKFGKAAGAGFSVALNYFNGKSVHGEYYDYRENYSAISFNLDL